MLGTVCRVSDLEDFGLWVRVPDGATMVMTASP